MKIRYFSDTDTALIDFSVAPVETKEISENLYIDLDVKGNLVLDRFSLRSRLAHVHPDNKEFKCLETQKNR